MAINHTIVQSWTDGGTTIEKTKTYSGEKETGVSESIADAVSDQQIPLEIDVSELQAILISSDQDLTIETNDGAAPQETLSIKAGAPFIWTVDSGLANPFAGDVTDFFVSNSSGEAAELEIRVLQNNP